MFDKMNKTIMVFIVCSVLAIAVASSQSSNFNVSLTLDSTSCTDGLQNQGESGVDCGGPCSACQSGNNNGGGGGGGSGFASNASKSLFIVKANDTIIFEFN